MAILRSLAKELAKCIISYENEKSQTTFFRTQGTMEQTYFLKWICPVISQHEMEILLAWLNSLLMQARAPLISNVSYLKVIPLVEPALENDHALAIFFPCFLTLPQAQNLRESIWSELFVNLNPGPKPFALSLQSEQISNTAKKLIAFDMDSTLINEEVIDELGRELGIYQEIAHITEEAMQGKLDFSESLKKRCQLFAGMRKDQALAIFPHLSVSPGGENLLQYLRSKSIRTAVLSGGFEFVLKHFQKLLLIDQVYGNTLETMINDDTNEVHFTGKVEEPIVDAAYKRKLVVQLKTNYRVTSSETVVVGDGANDMLMMEEAGISVSFCGKPKLASVVNTLILHRDLMWLKALL